MKTKKKKNFLRNKKKKRKEIPFSTFAVSPLSRVLLGCLLLLAVCLLWVLSSNLAFYLFLGGFNSPIFLTYFSTSLFSVFLLFRRGGRPLRLAPSLPVFPWWWVSIASANVALSWTTVTNATILSSTSSFFTLVAQRWRGRRDKRQGSLWDLYALPMLAVALSLAGVVLVVLSDSRSSSGAQSGRAGGHWVGDALALAGAVAYAGYSISVSDAGERAGRDSEMTLLGEGGRELEMAEGPEPDPLELLGGLGAIALACTWPMLVGAHISGLEPFELPNSAKTWGLLIGCALTGSVVANLLYLKAIRLCSSPLLATVAMSMGIPAALLFDASQHKIALTAPLLAGASATLAGFLISVKASTGLVAAATAG